MEDQDNKKIIKDKKKQKCEKKKIITEGEPEDSSKITVESDADEDIKINPENVKDEITKLKQNLLQSVAANENLLPQKQIEDAEEQETLEVLARIRKRSTSRPYEVPTYDSYSNQDVLKEIDESKLTELKEAFTLFDLDGDGCIDHNDLKGTLVSLGQEIDENDIRKMLSEASNPLDFDAFVILLGYKTIELDPEETLIDALSQWDYDSSGYISEERIRHDLMTWGDRFSEREVDWALEEAPTVQKKEDSMIDYIRFCKTLCGLRKANKRFNQ